MNRHVVAFLLAPLTVPLVMSALALQLLREEPSLYWAGLLIAAVVSYTGVLLVGAPVYMTLRSHGWSAFWPAPVVGSMAGVVALVIIVPLVEESGILFSVQAMFGDRAQWVDISVTHVTLGKAAVAVALVRPGALGALVGTVLWLIGRPDRP